MKNRVSNLVSLISEAMDNKSIAYTVGAVIILIGISIGG